MSEWFSFDGRSNRSRFWGVMIALWFMGIVWMVGMIEVREATTAPSVVKLLWGMLIVPLAWVWLATCVKRLHDRDKCGWWILFAWVPLVGPVWWLVDLGCLQGTDGPNRYDLGAVAVGKIKYEQSSGERPLVGPWN